MLRFNKIKVIVLFCILIVILFGTVNFKEDSKVYAFHTKEEIEYFEKAIDDKSDGEKSLDNINLPIGSNSLFKGSGKCGGCHGYDFGGLASVDDNGNDVNVTDDWRSSMMANSAKDPLWRAKVSHEILVNPGHQIELEDKCTSCHAPLGHFNAKFEDSNAHYSIAELVSDSLGLDGVSCLACHQQSPDSIGQFFSGKLKFNEENGSDRKAYGPYTAPLQAPMQGFAGYSPVYGEHIPKSELCASCHTLITETVDLEGNYTGNNFVEQATYHEWLNSVYNTPENPIECQGCHIPRINSTVDLAVLYTFWTDRTPFGLHEMVGGNKFMLEILKDNIDPLDLKATPEMFDSSIAKTLVMLRQKTLDLALTEIDRDEDTVRYEVLLTNKAGHKFPSGYPSRRAFIEFIVTDQNQDTIFKSGVLQNNFEVEGQGEGVEPHFQIINNQNQVQIYEMVLGDVTNNITTVLERANTALKDNRLAPLGFTTTHPSYDTTKIYGDALADIDFNKNDDGTEGTGSDKVFFHVPLDGYVGNLKTSVRVYFQAVPPRYLSEMFSYNSSEIDSFKVMYDNADKSPVLVAEQIIDQTSTGIFNNNRNKNDDIKVYPNPTYNGFVNLDNLPNNIHQIIIYNALGKVINILKIGTLQKKRTIQLPSTKGIYFIQLNSSEGKTLKKVARN
jgi:Secretion system C-terminal sorting domain/Cytochrome c554 and c-prime